MCAPKQSIDLGKTIHIGAETQQQFSFSFILHESKSSKFKFLPLEVQIQFWLGVITVAIWWSYELPWVYLSVFQPLLWFETCWDSPPKSSCRPGFWLWKLMMEMFWIMCDGLDEFYMTYWWCLNWKIGKCASGLWFG